MNATNTNVTTFAAPTLSPERVTEIINRTAGNYVIFTFSLRGWGGTKQDKRVTQETIAREGVGQSAGSFVKNLLGELSPGMKEIGNKTMAAKKAIDLNRIGIRNKIDTLLPPGGGGWKLRVPQVEDFLKNVWRPFLAQDAALVDQLVTIYPDFLSAYAFTNATGLFKREDYPTVDELRSLYRVRYNMTPMQKLASVDAIAERETSRLVAETMLAEMNEQIKESMQFAWDKLYASLDWAAKAAAEKGDGERAPSVHTTSVQKILSLVDDLKHLNIAEDQNMELARVQLEEMLKGKSIDSLKEGIKNDPLVREQIRDRVSRIRGML
jgi:hypothetical protein